MLNRLTPLPFAAALCCCATLGGAHPHVFVTTSLTLELDAQQRVVGVTMTWEYDDFFSLLIFEDMGLDQDADGVLSEPELDQLMGFDLIEWPEGFEGDLYLTGAQGPIEMPRPMPHDIAVRDGRIVATQKRHVPPTPAEGLVIRQYDPTYYVAYDLSQGITLPAPCRAQIEPADLRAAEAEIERLSKAQRAGEDLFMQANLGHLYADRIVVTCAQ